MDNGDMRNFIDKILVQDLFYGKESLKIQSHVNTAFKKGNFTDLTSNVGSKGFVLEIWVLKKKSVGGRPQENYDDLLKAQIEQNTRTKGLELAL